jgi:formate-dependent nitrite reductase cytochrome c552 subunit
MKNTVFILMLAFLAGAMLIAGCERKVVVEDDDNPELASCFTCHSDDNLALVQARGQWERSVHASGENLDRNRNNSSFYQSCEKCHTSEGFIAQVSGNPYAGHQFSAIGCFTCHAPHANGNLSLRVEQAVMLLDGSTFNRGAANLCASCHQSRQDVNTYVTDDVTLDSRWGPHHSNQADMLIGENAYEYASYTYTNSPHSNVATHGCVDCHMSGAIGYFVGGHTFNMRDEDSGYQNRTGCNASNCHDGNVTTLDILAAADFDGDGTTEGIQSEIHGLLDSLEALLFAAGFIDVSGHPIDEVDIGDSDSAGALYNWLFVSEDRSFGVHNTDYAAGLLQSSIGYLATGDPNGFGGGLLAAAKYDFISMH